MESPLLYIPMDRRQAMAQGRDLPDRDHGAVLVADVAGFTPLTEALAGRLGPRLGAEELVELLNAVYGALVGEVHRCGGSVVGFSGDAITCWFAADEGRRATACALALQQAMGRFEGRTTRSGAPVSLAIKVAVAAGPVRRFLVGDPRIQRLDVLAGATLERLAAAERQAGRGEVLVAPEVADRLGTDLEIAGRREAGVAGGADPPGPFAVVSGLASPVEATPWPVSLSAPQAAALLDEEWVRTWLLPPVYERLRAGQGLFLAELRPAVPLFLRFAGLEYDHDDAAGEKLDRYVRWVQGVLARYEGFLVQLTCGDKGSYLYAPLGAPLAHDDDPARAVAAALELCAAPPEVGSLTAVRIGISRGRVWVGAYGGAERRTYGVLGDEVNVAARLMEEAGPGEVLVSQRIAAAAGRSHTFEYQRHVELRGKKDPLPVYTPRARPLPSPQRPATRFAAPLVGREGELEQMEQALSAVVAGQGSILRLQGEAGIGKSRLAAEFVQRALGRGQRVALGACDRTWRGITYTPWRQIFRVLFGLEEGAEAAAEVVARVEAAVRQANPDWLPRLPLLGDLLDLPIPDNQITAAFSPQLRQESLFALAVALVQAWAAAQPLLLLIEDAHWMDEASLGLAVALGRVIGRVPLLLVLVHRPLTRQEQPLWPEIERMPHQQCILLGELPPHGIRALAGHRLGADPTVLTLSLVEALSQGNPFFAEELVDALHEAGAVYPGEDGSWVLSEPICRALREAHCLTKKEGQWVLSPEARLPALDLGIPDSLCGLVLSRVDRLPEPAKLTLKVASVIGRSFEFDLLTGAHPAAPGQSVLLQQMELLQGRDFARLEIPEPRRTYLFKHSITQEVVYQTLLEDQQRELHRAVAGALEDLQPEAVGRLAYHYSHSGVRGKAVHYLRRAGEQAAARYANAEAVGYLSRALELLPAQDRVGRYDLLMAREQVLGLQGEREAQRQDLAALQLLAEALRDERRQAEVTLRRATYAEEIGDYPLATGLDREVIRLAQAHGQADLEAMASLHLGWISWARGDYPRARAELEQALALVRRAGLRSEEAECLRSLGNVACMSGGPSEGEQYYRQTLALCRKMGDRQGEGSALNNLGIARQMQADPSGARQYYEQALALYRQIGYRRGEGLSLLNVGLILRGQGSYLEALACYGEALRVSEEIGDRHNQCGVLGNLGEAARDLGDYERARSWHERGLNLCREIGHRHTESRILYDSSLRCHQAGDNETARDLARQALRLTEQLNDTDGQVHSWTSLGNALLALGDPAQAVEAYRRALDLRRQMGYFITQPLAGLAGALLAAGDLAQAQAHVEEVLQFVEQEPSLVELAEPLRVYLTCYQVLRAGSDPRAGDVLARGYRLLQEHAARIDDEALRRSFLENVPVHREILREMAEVHPPPDADASRGGQTSPQG